MIENIEESERSTDKVILIEDTLFTFKRLYREKSKIDHVTYEVMEFTYKLKNEKKEDEDEVDQIIQYEEYSNYVISLKRPSYKH